MFYFAACVKVLNLVTLVLIWPTQNMCSGVYLAYFFVCKCSPMENPWGSWWVTVELSLVIKTRSSFHHCLCRVPRLQDSIIYIVISTKYECNVFSFWHRSVCKWMDLNASQCMQMKYLIWQCMTMQEWLGKPIIYSPVSQEYKYMTWEPFKKKTSHCGWLRTCRKNRRCVASWISSSATSSG